MDNVISIAITPLWTQLAGFLEQGGIVLHSIMLTTFLLWLLILERQHYFRYDHHSLCNKVVDAWLKRDEHKSWHAEKIRLQFLSIVNIRAQRNLSTIKLIVMVAPLLGLLGTVTGMINVFDVMAATGSSNARAMAAGVSKATIPTMAGMVVSLSGLLFSVFLRRKAASLLDSLAGSLIVKERVASKRDTKAKIMEDMV